MSNVKQSAFSKHNSCGLRVFRISYSVDAIIYSSLPIKMLGNKCFFCHNLMKEYTKFLVKGLNVHLEVLSIKAQE